MEKICDTSLYEEDDDISRHYYEVIFNSTLIKRPERPLKGDPSRKSMVSVKNAKKNLTKLS
jgi:hypothetical protein